MPATSDGRLFSRPVMGWMLYDWANSAFALSVMTAFFPVFFKRFWCVGQEASFSTIRLNLGNAAAGLSIALLAPVIGALADAGRSRKRFLLFFMLLGVGATGMLAVVPQGAWFTALVVFGSANIGFAGANLFYDALLPCVAPSKRMDMVSSAGYALGYIGCALLFALNLAMVANPPLFGLRDSAAAVRWSFILAAGWWLVFSVPLLVWVHEPREGKRDEPMIAVIRGGMTRLKGTVRDIAGHRHLWLFLLAYWCYIDGVDTFIRAAVDLGLSIGIEENGLMISLLVVQLVAFPFAYLFGIAAGKLGTHTAILVGIAIYICVTIGGPLVVTTPLLFGVFAAISAIPLGALQALSRSYWARMIPPEKAAEYFGFYNLIGKFSVVLGPALVAGVAALVRAVGGTSAQAARYGFGSISIFFVAGAFLLSAAARAEKDAGAGRHAVAAANGGKE